MCNVNWFSAAEYSFSSQQLPCDWWQWSDEEWSDRERDHKDILLLLSSNYEAGSRLGGYRMSGAP